MVEDSTSKQNPCFGYMTEKIQKAYISKAIKFNVLPQDAHRLPEILSLVASKNLSKPIQFWQLYSVLGQNNILRIVQNFYERVFQDEDWFESIFARIGDASHHIRTQGAMWLDVMGGGYFYHGAEFRLNFHHQHNALELMNKKGAQRWLDIMVETLDQSEQFMTNDFRVRISINTFLTYFMEKYMLDFNFKITPMFGVTNMPYKMKVNFLNMTDNEIESLSENELKEALLGRGIESETLSKAELIEKAKSL